MRPRVRMTNSRRPLGRPGRGAAPAASVAALGLSLLFLLGSAPPTGGSVLLRFHAGDTTKGATSVAPLTAATVTAGAGACLTTGAGAVPFVAGNSRGSAAIVEPRGCPTNTRLVFLPALRFTNALPVPAGHVLNVRLDVVSDNGSTTILRNVQFYVVHLVLGNPIVTGTHATILRGVITRTSTSTATLAAASTYGIGLRMQLTRLAATSTAHVALVVYLVDADGGATNAVVEQWTEFTFTY